MRVIPPAIRAAAQVRSRTRSRHGQAWIPTPALSGSGYAGRNWIIPSQPATPAPR